MAAPPGSPFMGYQDVVVRDLVLEACVTRDRRERWHTPSGETLVAALPAGVAGGLGPHLRRLLLAAHVQGQVTTERLRALLAGVGVPIFQAAGGRLHRNEAGLLRVLERPEIPLHTNGSENTSAPASPSGGSRAAR